MLTPHAGEALSLVTKNRQLPGRGRGRENGFLSNTSLTLPSGQRDSSVSVLISILHEKETAQVLVFSRAI